MFRQLLLWFCNEEIFVRKNQLCYAYYIRLQCDRNDFETNSSRTCFDVNLSMQPSIASSMLRACRGAILSQKVGAYSNVDIDRLGRRKTSAVASLARRCFGNYNIKPDHKASE